jgi:chemotaxis protein CheD
MATRRHQRDDQSDVLLHPGDCFVGDASHRIRTVLGSCISVTLWCPKLRVGAMSHSLLATRPPHAEPSSRYGDDALKLMLARLELLGVSPAACEAKIFGGGHMFRTQSASGPMEIGRRNGEAARSLLRAHGIEPVSESLFGEGHRQIVFDVATGHVWCRQLGLS